MAEHTACLECRSARVEDASNVGQLIVAAWQRAYADLMPKAFLETFDPVAIAAKWQKTLSPRGFRRVVTLDGKVVGACSGGLIRDADAPEAAELYSINVHPDSWAKGAGAVLLREAELSMIEEGFTSAVLWVLSGNTRAQRFYAAKGWLADGAERSSKHVVGTSLSELRYRSVFTPPQP